MLQDGPPGAQGPNGGNGEEGETGLTGEQGPDGQQKDLCAFTFFEIDVHFAVFAIYCSMCIVSCSSGCLNVLLSMHHYHGFMHWHGFVPSQTAAMYALDTAKSLLDVE